MTPEEVIALVQAVGVSEAARRSGYPKPTVGRWSRHGPPVAGPRVTTKQVVGEGEGSNPDADPSRPSHARDDRDDTDRPPGWRPGWKRKSERLAELVPPPRLVRVPTPEEVPRDARLTDVQNVALHLLLCGYHPGDILTALAITEWELGAWRRDPVFREVHKAGTAEMQSLQLENGIAFGAMALEALYRIGMDPTVPERTRGMCLASYLDRVGYAKTKRLEVSTAVTGSDLRGVPKEQLDAEENAAREELRLIQGGKG